MRYIRLAVSEELPLLLHRVLEILETDFLARVDGGVNGVD